MPITHTFRIEQDPFYEQGKEEGIQQEREQKNYDFVKSLILKSDFTDQQTADVANVTLDFVQQVRASLK